MEEAGRGNMDQNANVRGDGDAAKLYASRVQLCGRRSVSTWTSQLLNRQEIGDQRPCIRIISVTCILLLLVIINSR